MREIHLKKIVLEYFLKSSKNLNGIGFEIAVDHRETRADVVCLLNKRLHCMEIKSARDSLDRLYNQLASYSKYFDYVSIAVEEKHLEKATELAPEHVGIYLFLNGRLIKKRKEKIIKSLDPKSILSTINVRHLKSISTTVGIKSNGLMKEELVDALSNILTLKNALFHSRMQISLDLESRLKIFEREKGQIVTPDDISLLSKKAMSNISSFLI
ncbi:sce7726 family protein [Rheinheimera soli]|uniref:sce7726 family protein n=1 Tax=Rheinheimera soli TaxID=443616 RepID=UPI001E2B8038|nr:sce7726 family protein [Rheinheimera soli]